MSFEVSAAYGRFMGRYAEPLAVRFVALARPAACSCRPGAQPLVPAAPFEIEASAWAAVGRA